MTLKQRYEGILGYFRENVPVAESELHFDSPFQLLVAVILSAQCTDKRVNMTTPALFAAYPDPESLAAAEFDDVLALVRSISYPNSKARHLIGMAQKLLSDFGGQVSRSSPWTRTSSAWRGAWDSPGARRHAPWNSTLKGTSRRSSAPSRITG